MNVGPSSFLDRLLGGANANWFRAMRTETKHIDSSTGRLLWNTGIVVAILRCATRKMATDNGRIPLELTATALYLVGFSVYIISHLAAEIIHSGIREPWAEAWFPIVVSFWMAIIPSVVAIGIWLCDDLARKLAVAFALFELGMVISFVHSYGVSEFRFLKFVCTLAVLAATLSPRARVACGWRSDNPSTRSLGIST